MKTRRTKTFVTSAIVLGLMICGVEVVGAVPLGTAFTYQGRLVDSNQPADGLYDFEFVLYDDPDPNVVGQVAGPIHVESLDVIEGYFGVVLDFGSEVFDGDARWLEVCVRPGELEDPNVYTVLLPRQEIAPVPYALHINGLLLLANNTFVGKDAGTSNTKGYRNTFSGYQAGYSNTTGIGNTFSGEVAGFYNTEGNYNTFSGSSAGRSNATGYNNTFSGFEAGYRNTIGYQNTFSGYHAGYSNTTGHDNIFLGNSAGYSNTTGVSNTFSGVTAGKYNTTGYNNTFSGYCAGYSNGIGFANTFLGMYAGYYNTTGSGNTFTGGGAGYRNTTGRSNTFLGVNAGSSNTTGSGNVFVGYSAAGSGEKGSNKLYIANDQYDPNVLIYGDFSTRRVGIGTTTPGANLEVNGQVKISGGSPAAGKVLTSDAGGLATWQTPVIGDSGWVISGNNMYSGVSGTVGIGTSSSLAKLNVEGNITVASGYGYMIAGDKVLSISGTDNVFVGVGAGASNTTGTWNTFSGRQAGYSNTTGYSNTFSGRDAGYSNTTGNSNTFSGYRAGGNSNTGSYNTFLGKWAGISNQTGNGNVFIGNEAGYNETGSNKLYIANSYVNPPLIYGEFDTGRVGIGTTNPGNRLDVEGGMVVGASYSGTNTAPINGLLVQGDVGIGTTSPGARLDVLGKIRISDSSGNPLVELGEGLDYAEGFAVSDKTKIGPGSVVVIDADNPGKLMVSDTAYDKKVAGIVAGAKGLGSGVRLASEGFDANVALAGRVYCNVDATEAAVEPGDLLTTSATPGYAMQATDYDRAQGAILGKAMERLEKGQKGQILVLVTLQ